MPAGIQVRWPILIAAAAGFLAILLGGALLLRGSSPAHPDLARAEKAAAAGDWAQGFELYDQALRAYPSDAAARAGREEARRRLLAADLAELDRALDELGKARAEVETCRNRPKAQTLDQEQRYADQRRAAEEKLPRAEERVRTVREQVQRTLTLGVK